ncbi:OmpA family protein [bacterium]|nr:OmpA family protein [bacterium]
MKHHSAGVMRAKMIRALAFVFVLGMLAGCVSKIKERPLRITTISHPAKPAPTAVKADDETTSGTANTGEMRPANPMGLGEGARLLVGREFDPIYFDSDSTELDSEARRKLNEYVTWLKEPEHGHVWIALVGYCDSGQAVKFGYNLAMARALAAEEFLVANGLDRKRIYSIGYGRATDEPTANRVELLGFVGPDGKSEPDQVPAGPEEMKEE